MASISLSAEAACVFTEPQTGAEFPCRIRDGTQHLAGTGLRKKSVLGLKSIIVYAFGVYADAESLKQQLGAANFSPEELKDATKSQEMLQQVASSDVEMTVRLSIVYGSLKISSVRSAFHESLGGRIKKYKGAEDKQLLQSFTSLFKDDIQLPSGTTIEVSRLPGHQLKMTIDEQELGSVESELLCRCFFDLYIGDEPFDKSGRAAIAEGMAALLFKQEEAPED